MVHVSTLSHINHPGPKKHMYINVHQRSVEASRLPVPASWNKSLLPANMPQFNSSPQQWSCCNVWWLGHPKQRKPSAELGWAHFPIAFAVNFRLAWGQNSTCWILEQILYIYIWDELPNCTLYYIDGENKPQNAAWSGSKLEGSIDDFPIAWANSHKSLGLSPCWSHARCETSFTVTSAGN